MLAADSFISRDNKIDCTNKTTFNNKIDPDSEIVMEAYKVINKYWAVIECKYRFEECPFNSDNAQDIEKEYIKSARELQLLSQNLSIKIINSLEKNDKKSLSDIVSVYLSYKKALRTPLYDVADRILNWMVKTELEKYAGSENDYNALELRKQLEQEFFPGYGYADPGYLYRKGLELERQLLQTFWKTEKEIIEANSYMELVIKAELLSNLQSQVSFLKILKLFDIEIDGKIVAAAKVSFQLKKTLVTQARIKYEKNKVWVELYKASKDFWLTPKWTLAGKTYILLDEPTGQEVIVNSILKENIGRNINPEAQNTLSNSESKINSEEPYEELINILVKELRQDETITLQILADYFGSDYFKNASDHTYTTGMQFLNILQEYYIFESVNNRGFSKKADNLIKQILTQAE
jgi:hypothetical protein